jgi:GR25 family glycosyltransferase involved in LPS biosynthesis
MKIYCINLDRRPDRWEKAKEQHWMNGLNVERFPAVDGRDFVKNYPCDPGNNGCTLSHYFIVERAKLLGLPMVMVLEDDADLHIDFNALLKECMESLPEDWDMLYFGGTHKKRPKIENTKILRVIETYTTHGYIIRESMYDAVLDNFKYLNEPVDCLYVDLQTRYNCYVTDPPIAWQRGGFSDIVGRDMHYPWIKSNIQ